MGLIEMSTQERRKWAQVRAKGKRSYVVRRGMLGLGLPMAIVMPLGRAGLEFLESGALDWNRIVASGLIGLPIWLGAGMWFGCWMWSWSEHSWHRPHPPD